ncbi:MAG: hypothetical protein GC160_02870 [Acidobacteria bacterium]|nr:hypothetical protein [Acidobacteriota bacterium]
MNTQVQPTIVPLTRYQRAWVEDGSRFKLSVKSRRIGYSFATTLEIALDMVARGSEWTMISRAQSNARELVRDLKRHLQAMSLAAADVVADAEDASGLELDGMQLTVFRLELANGARCHALTAHPDAARGFGGNLFLDEFGFHRDSVELWRGAAATAMRDANRVIVVSTPNYQQGKYFELARKCGLTDGLVEAQRGQAGIWSWHRVTLEQAIPEMAAVGQHVDMDTMRELADDEETFQQEFCCAFLTSSEMWIGPELIAAARSAWATKEWNPERSVEGDLYVGMDIGRKKDRTVIWIDERFSTGLSITRGVVELHKMPFYQQLAVAEEIARHRKVKRFAVDATGIGMMLAEELQRRFGSRVEPVMFTQQSKEEMAVIARRRFEERLSKIPENAPEIERALMAIKRQATPTGSLRFDAERSDQGHADHAWAKFLADYAGERKGCGAPEWQVGEQQAWSQAAGW